MLRDVRVVRCVDIIIQLVSVVYCIGQSRSLLFLKKYNRQLLCLVCLKNIFACILKQLVFEI
jgi:hypothetical protein